MRKARQEGGISSACIYAKYMRHQQKKGPESAVCRALPHAKTHRGKAH